MRDVDMVTVVNDIDHARQQTLSDLTRRSARRFADKTALVDGDVRITFGELDELVDKLAASLADLGLVKGDRLAIVARNSWCFPLLSFATARVGVIFTPLNYMLTAGELAYMFGHAEPRLVVADASTITAVSEALGEARSVRPALYTIGSSTHDGWSPLADLVDRPRPDVSPAVPLGDDEPIRMMYTSGTESRPKGALLSSRSLMWQYISCISTGEMHSDDIEVHALPLYHCAQLDNFLSTDIYLGATSIILPSPDPELILQTIAREGVTNLFCPPTVWISLLRSPDLGSYDLSSLRKGYYGASAMPVEVLAQIRETFPNVRLWNFYGQTEMASLASALGPDDQVSHAGSAGRAALNVETRIVDDLDREVAPGVVGEIVHRSPQLTLGYYRDPEKTAEAFAGGWFHSGDLGFIDADGYLSVVDRKKDMIKSGGENVASREVEEVLYQHPAVAEVAVFGVAHPVWIEAVAAVVVLRDGATATPEEIISFCRAQLAGYKTPKIVWVTDQLPKNPSGKILKRALREEFTPDLSEIGF